MKLYFVIRPSLRGTTIPVYYYTFAETPEKAIQKVSLRYGEYDNKSRAMEIVGDKLDELVIATDYI
jgi:hypothetical protein